MSNSLASFSEELAGVVARASQAVVSVHGRSRFESSGVHWAPGVIVTAEHALRRDEEIRVSAPDGSQLDAELAGRDPGTDLAVLRVPGLKGAVAEASEKTPVPGNLALAIGRFKDSALAAFGVISSVSGPSQTWRGGRLDQVVRVDVALHPAASGGAIVGPDGKLLGIATPVLSRVAVFAIPPSTVRRVVETLLAHGRIPRGYLGVGLQPVAIPEHLKNTLKLPAATGLIVISVDPEAPAGQAGIMIGDVFLELDGSTIERPQDVQRVLDSGSVGKKVNARVIRGGQLLAVELTVGERPRKG